MFILRILSCSLAATARYLHLLWPHHIFRNTFHLCLSSSTSTASRFPSSSLPRSQIHDNSQFFTMEMNRNEKHRTHRRARQRPTQEQKTKKIKRKITTTMKRNSFYRKENTVKWKQINCNFPFVCRVSFHSICCLFIFTYVHRSYIDRETTAQTTSRKITQKRSC